MVDKEPCQALFKDVVEKLLSQKQEDCEIVLGGDFNDDVYRRKFSERLTKDDFNMTEHILKITGGKIPHTYDRGSKAICISFCNCRGCMQRLRSPQKKRVSTKRQKPEKKAREHHLAPSPYCS